MIGHRNPKAPAYEICTRNPAGTHVQVGALWEQTSKATGECFLQGRIDDPSMSRPLAISAFRQTDGSYNVAWLRPRRGLADPFAAAANRALGKRAGFLRNEQLMNLKPVHAVICEGSGLQSNLLTRVREANIPHHAFALPHQRIAA